MKALVIIVLFALLAIAHPMALALVLAAELAGCGMAAWMIRRAFRRIPGIHWRTA